MKTDSLTQREITRKRNNLLACGHVPSSVPAALLHSEIRCHLKAMNPAEREAVLESANPDVWQAVILAPAFLSGVSSETIASLRLKYVTAVHAVEWSELNRLENELSLCEDLQ